MTKIKWRSSKVVALRGQSKTCTKCKEYLDLAYFYKHERGYLKTTSRCKTCYTSHIGPKKPRVRVWKQEETDGSSYVDRLINEVKAKEREFFLESIPQYANTTPVNAV